MPVSQFNLKNAVLLLIVLIAAALRVASFEGWGPLTLFSPLGAMALFGGAHISGRYRPFLFPLLTLFLSDVVVSAFIFPQLKTGMLYSGWYWTYASFALITMAGRLIIRKTTTTTVLTATIVATFIHWTISDLGMCVESNRFSASLYVQKLAEAVPYELRFMAGTIVFSAILFGGFRLIQKKQLFLHVPRGISHE